MFMHSCNMQIVAGLPKGHRFLRGLSARTALANLKPARINPCLNLGFH